MIQTNFLSLPPITTKKCNKCGEIKLLNNFYEDKKSKDKLLNKCKSCCKIYYKKYYQNHKKEKKEYGKEYNKKYRKENSKKVRNYGKKYYQNNKEERKNYNKKYYLKKAKKLRKRSRLYRKENPERISSYRNQYRKTHLEYFKEYNKIYRKKYFQKPENKVKRNKNNIQRRNSNPQLKLRHSISNQIRERLKRRLIFKNGKSTFSFLPYTIEDLIKHLEDQFEPWMNWNNYGRQSSCWSIDHIKPDSSFHYTSVEDKEFQECWALSNLRPMKHIENMKKGKKLIWLLLPSQKTPS